MPSPFFLLLFLLMSFCAKSTNVLIVWQVSWSVHFSLLFIWKGWFIGSVLGLVLIYLKWAWSLTRPNTFPASASSSFYWIFLVKVWNQDFWILKVSEKNECFDKFITSLGGLDPYLILFLKTILLNN